jgi:hypothetical protein
MCLQTKLSEKKQSTPCEALEKKNTELIVKRKCAELFRNLDMCSETDEEDRGKGVKL